MQKPLVSVYVPTRNRPLLLRRAVASALAQDYPAVQVIVVVDGPDVATENVLRELGADRRLMFAVRPETGGACAARNDALARAEGVFATGLDDDDELLPNHVSNLVEALEKTRAAFACTTSILRRPDGDVVRHAWSGAVELKRLLRENVVGNQVLTKTEYLLEIGAFDTQMPAWQDYDLWVRLTSRFGPGFRVDARTYVQDASHSAPRISQANSIVKAHELFVAKHASLLDEHQRASLELLMHATTHDPFPLRRLPAYVAAGCTSRALAALISDRFPAFRTPVRRLLATANRHQRRG